MAQAREDRRVRLKPADSFDLIRLIARSQSDPRKALAELVQNSLDAGARQVRVTWFTQQGARAISVWDDGAGVFPELDREQALERIATTIGASHKAHLTPMQRHAQMTLGKYGIGLLGFWSVGRRMEIRSRVAGSEVRTLRLEADARDAELGRLRTARLVQEATFTEVVISDVHEAAAAQIKPRRLAAYLAGELRGQLLQRDVRLEIHDRVARGRAAKCLVVRPQRFAGVPVEGLCELPVPGFATARVELYVVPEGEERLGHVALAGGGATVHDDVASIDGLDAPREPWASGRFEGVIDFPDLTVAPGTRRGFVPDEAASAFSAALPAVESRCREVLVRDAERRRLEREADDARDLRRLFRRLPRALPHYTLFDVRDGGESGHRSDPKGVVEPEAAQPPEVAEEEPESYPEEAPAAELLYPRGPLASVDIRPRRSVLPPEGTRRLRAVSRDGDARELMEGVAYAWHLAGPGELTAEGDTAVYVAPPEPGTASVVVEATQGAARAEAEAELRVSDAVPPEDRGGAGIPDPEPVLAPTDGWRSRIQGQSWQYNTGHGDYREVRDDPRRRLRYLTHLFAKEIVLRNFGEPGHADLLERMVQVLTYVGEAVARR